MNFKFTQKSLKLQQRVQRFMDEHIIPVEHEYYNYSQGDKLWDVWPGLEKLKELAKAEGLWNLFLPEGYGALSPGLSNLEYAPLAEIMGSVAWASEVFNCSAPDTGNMEVLAKYGTAEQQDKWLKPLMNGELRSAFLMTEPRVASSDATNIETSIVRDGDEYVINGRKWWSSGALDKRCKVFIVMGKTDPSASRHTQQSMILVEADRAGVDIMRAMQVFGNVDAPHGHAEVDLVNVRVPVSNLLLGEGRGFEIAQGRLGPGRIHHCMRWLGIAERAFDLMCKRAVSRMVAPGRPLGSRQIIQQWVAECRAEIDAARLYVHHAAQKIDTEGTYAARSEISCVKFFVADMLTKVLDRSIQTHGALGMTDDLPLAWFYAHERAAHIYDGPDEVHKQVVARRILKSYGLEIGSQGR